MINYLVFYCRFFEVNPHPNDNDKTRLSEELGLTPLQVKFWFQNRRNQIKVTLLFFFFLILLWVRLCNKPV